VDEEVLNAYCWMYSSFQIPADFMVCTAASRYRQTSRYSKYSSRFQILGDFMVCTAKASRYWQIS
jgi:hypothetical protein